VGFQSQEAQPQVRRKQDIKNLPVLTSAVIAVAGGTVSGSAINGTITGGTAAAALLNGLNVEVPDIHLYGQSDDGVPFFVTETGIGTPDKQFTRIVRLSSALSLPDIQLTPLRIW
jgi:hypothetical protein